MSQQVGLLINPALVKSVVDYNRNDPERLQGIYFGLSDENYDFLVNVLNSGKDIVQYTWKPDQTGGFELGRVLGFLHQRLIDSWIEKEGNLPLCVLLAIGHLMAVEVVMSQQANDEHERKQAQKMQGVRNRRNGKTR